MTKIPCFLLEPTDRVAIYLRRYYEKHARHHKNQEDDSCPFGSYHNALFRIEDEPVEEDEEGYICNGINKEKFDKSDPRWPKTCTCGYEFQEQDEWQRFCDQIYRRVDTNEEMTIDEAPAGAIWYAPWMDMFHVPQDEHNLVVKTPGGLWSIDSFASNCTMPDDTKQERHHCWVRHGIPPNITVDKNGKTCGAGAGSIQCGNYHGFLINGWLES